jgi:hypothetical protein
MPFPGVARIVCDLSVAISSRVLRCRLRHRLAPPPSRPDAATLTRVQLTVSDEHLHIRLARWQKILGLMKDVVVPIADVSDVRVVDDPFAEIKGSGLKAGLRVPRLYYVARTIGLDQVFVVRRGTTALSFEVQNHEPLRHVLVSTPEAEQLARRLRAR